MNNMLTPVQKYAHEIVHECNEAWKKLISGEAPAGEIDLTNSTVQGSPGYTTSDAGVPAANPQPAAPIDSSISKSFFISSASS